MMLHVYYVTSISGNDLSSPQQRTNCIPVTASMFMLDEFYKTLSKSLEASKSTTIFNSWNASAIYYHSRKITILGGLNPMLCTYR